MSLKPYKNEQLEELRKAVGLRILVNQRPGKQLPGLDLSSSISLS